MHAAYCNASWKNNPEIQSKTIQKTQFSKIMNNQETQPTQQSVAQARSSSNQLAFNVIAVFAIVVLTVMLMIDRHHNKKMHDIQDTQILALKAQMILGEAETVLGKGKEVKVGDKTHDDASYDYYEYEPGVVRASTLNIGENDTVKYLEPSVDAEGRTFYKSSDPHGNPVDLYVRSTPFGGISLDGVAAPHKDADGKPYYLMYEKSKFGENQLMAVYVHESPENRRPTLYTYPIETLRKPDESEVKKSVEAEGK